MTYETAATVVRIVVTGRTCRCDQMDNHNVARAMLSDALESSGWPARVTSFAVTPGGFVRTQRPVIMQAKGDGTQERATFAAWFRTLKRRSGQ